MINSEIFDRYLMELRKTPIEEQTEHSSRSALEALLTAFAPSGAQVTHEPKRATDKGAPDFKISSSGMILGYVENKKVGENLEVVRRSAQIKKYLTLSPNILLTDYLTFTWISPTGAQTETLAGFDALEGKPPKLREDRIAALAALLRGFFSRPPQGIAKARALAEALAIRSQMLRDYLGEELVAQQDSKTGGKLLGLFHAFKQQVSHELTLHEFADAFAQTLAYGLFLAKLNTGEGEAITLANAKAHVPTSFGLIRELVSFLDELDSPEYASIRWVVEEVLSIINGLNLAALQEDLAFKNRRARRGTEAKSEEEWRLFSRDPFIYFYEDYLAKYDAKMRKSRGVYYTPPPIVNFIVRAINDILKDTFGITEGLADRKRVTVLDFACGTGTFLVEVLERIFEEIGGADSGKAPLVVSEHILKNIYGFEYLIAPYTIAHLKLSQYLAEQGHTLKQGERFQVYLTNTLEPIEAQRDYMVPALSDETEAAQAIKKKPILVITGNPPYSGKSKNNGPFAKASVGAYAKGPKNIDKPDQPKWLQNDYVKFLKFAQSKMDEVEEGIVAVITAHSYLDGQTFAFMRYHLQSTFDQIHIVDLHGNADKKETTPTGELDQNVFDIKTGVAIAIFVKRPGVARGVWHTDWWGRRQLKYELAVDSQLEKMEFDKLDPQPPHVLFKPSSSAGAAAYTALWSVPAIFSPSGKPAPGLVTLHDDFAISFTASESRQKLIRFVQFATRADADREFKLCKQGQWSFEQAKIRIPTLEIDALLEEVAYRPFDLRWTVWDTSVAVHLRVRANGHMLRPNVALLTSKVTKGEEFAHVLAVDRPAEAISLSSKTSNNAFIFPLYLYPPAQGERKPKVDLFGIDDPFEGKNRIENIAAEFRAWIEARYTFSPTPEQIFGYVYATLHAPTYRADYADFLRTDFPRIPFPEGQNDFEALADLGWDLAEMHLMRRIPKRGRGEFTGKGDNAVVKPRWSEVEQTVWFNATQGFKNVPEAVWTFTIGGYQVIEKYLKSRKGRKLSLDEIENVEKVANILDYTIEAMRKIDAAYVTAFGTDP